MSREEVIHKRTIRDKNEMKQRRKDIFIITKTFRNERRDECKIKTKRSFWLLPRDSFLLFVFLIKNKRTCKTKHEAALERKKGRRQRNGIVCFLYLK